MDEIREVGKYLKYTKRTTDYSLKRDFPPQVSIDRVRDLFDSTHPLKAEIKIPPAAKHVKIDVNFGRRLPSLECCGDCMCGSTESYTSDSLVSNTIYLSQPYLAGSVVVYLDGTLSTSFVESNPDVGAVYITVPFNTIVISYVYSTGNCTEADLNQGSPIIVEHWADREYEETITKDINGGYFLDPLVTDVVASRAWDDNPIGGVGTSLTRTFVRHLAPANAKWGRLKFDVYSLAVGADDPGQTKVGIYIGDNLDRWDDTSTLARFEDVNELAIETDVLSNFAVPAGPFSFQCVIPVIGGSLGFVFADTGPVVTNPTESAQWNSYLQAPAEVYGGPLKYELTFYG